MSLSQVTYTNEKGMKKVVLLPEGSFEIPSKGIPVGPPSLEELGLPVEIETRINNELYSRNILTAQDALKKRAEIVYAIQAALRVDADGILGIYLGGSYQNARMEKQEVAKVNEPNNRVRRNRPPRRPVKV
jgi:hypothetical protein